MRVLVGYIDNCKSSGIDHYLIDFAKQYLSDDVSIDFLTRNSSPRVKKMINSLGCGLHVISRNRHPVRQLFEMRRIVKNGGYDIAYFNISESYNCIGIAAAKLFGIKKVIVHSHSSGTEKRFLIQRALARILNYIFKPVITFNSNLNISCSDKAAKWLFPNNIFYNDAYVELNNSIDDDPFSFNEKARDRIRTSLGLDGCYIIGSVGRLSYQKNYSFLIKSFAKVSKKIPEARLVLIGDGPERDKLQRVALSRGVSDKVLFIDPVDNIWDYLSAFDCFALSSRFEGYPYVGIEAQANGLPCVFSSRITKSINISGHSRFVSIRRHNEWARQLVDIKKQRRYAVPKAKSKKQNILKLAASDSACCPSFVAFAIKALLCVHYAINLTATFNGFNYLLIPTALLLLIFALHKFPDFFARKLTNFKVFLPLLLFVVSYVLTFLIAKQYATTESLKVLLWTILHFFFIFDCFYLKTTSNAKRELYIVSKTALCAFSLINLHNLFLLIFRVSKVSRVYNGNLHRYGLSTFGRFFGNFYDANYASVVCAACTFIALYLFTKTRSLFRRMLLVAAMALNLIYIFMSESRTGLIALAAAIVATAFFSILSSRKKIILKATIGVACVFVFVVVAPKFSLGIYNYLHQPKDAAEAIATTPSEKTHSEDLANEGAISEVNNKKYQQPAIGRTDSKSDQSNGRFDIWKDALSISKDNLATGIGFTNILPYSRDKRPYSYIAKKKMSASHNSVLDVLVSQGVVGASCLLLMVGVLLSLIIRGAIRRAFRGATILALSAISSVIAASMFVSQIFYVNNMPTYLFWLFAGYSVFLLSRGPINESR